MKMVKRNSRRKETPKPHTSAWMAFEQNLGSISHMLALSNREAVRLKRQAVRMTGLFTPTPDLTAALTRKKLLRSLKRFLKTVSTGFERFQTISLWQIVMLVTCVEAYLQDVLAAAAAVDPQLMDNSEQHATYPDVIDATSLDALAAVMRTRWARNWWADALDRPANENGSEWLSFQSGASAGIVLGHSPSRCSQRGCRHAGFRKAPSPRSEGSRRPRQGERQILQNFSRSGFGILNTD